VVKGFTLYSEVVIFKTINYYGTNGELSEGEMDGENR
jgi:hypothetical protein